MTSESVASGDQTEYTVFELYEHSRNSIGTVSASSHEEAVDKAHQQYGGPIEVEAL